MPWLCIEPHGLDRNGGPGSSAPTIQRVSKMLDPLTLVLLAGAGLTAGFVDAIAGGGGLISVPVLLSVGVPPVGALATNKLQSAMGTSVAAFTYWRGGYVKLTRLVPAVAATFAGSFLGAFTVNSLDTSFLAIVVPVALIGVAGYFLLGPRPSEVDKAARLSFSLFVPVMGFAVGFYDGLFGPGTGSFMTLGFVTLFGLGIVRASAHTKLLNLTSNLAALILFMWAGAVIWPAALAMASGQVIGGWLGAHTGIRYGARIIRPLVVLVSSVLAVRLLLTAR